MEDSICAWDRVNFCSLALRALHCEHLVVVLLCLVIIYNRSVLLVKKVV